MVEKFRAELRSLKGEVVEMGDLALDMLQRAVKALETRDVGAVKSFDRDKKRLADQDHEIEQECLRLIALYQPVAKDLRTIATALKMNTYLYRIGRYGKDIAILVPDLADAPVSSDCLDGIPVMADLVIGMVTDALTAFERNYGAAPSAIFVTHVHMDHVAGLERLFFATYFDPERRGKVRLYVPVTVLPHLQARLADYPGVTVLVAWGRLQYERFQAALSELRARQMQVGQLPYAAWEEVEDV